MSSRQVSQWRSVGFALAVTILLAACFGLTAYWALVHVKPEAAPQLAALLPAIAGMFGSLCLFAGAAVGFAFGKSLGEKAADGTGLKGMARVIVTDAKAGDASPPEGVA